MELFHIINRFIHKNRIFSLKNKDFIPCLSTFVILRRYSLVSNSLIRRIISPHLYIIAFANQLKEKHMNYFSNLFIGRKQNVVQATGYLDTGNTLKDISTGKHVVIASPEIMYDLLPLQLHALVYDYTNGIQPFDRKSSIYMPEGIHLIPYRTISSESDLMLAFDCDFFFINNHIICNRPLIGISRHTLQISHMKKCILLNSVYMRKVRNYDKHIRKSRF